MWVELISIAVLVGVFVISTVLHVHMGALRLSRTFVVGFGLPVCLT